MSESIQSTLISALPDLGNHTKATLHSMFLMLLTISCIYVSLYIIYKYQQMLPNHYCIAI